VARSGSLLPRLLGVAVALAVALGGVLLADSESKAVHSVEGRFEFVEVDSDDLEALKEWAEGTCRGWTVQNLASALEVDPTMEAVVAHISRGLPAESRQVVIEACELELNRAATGEPPLES
jgi:hypothetical protein